MGQARNHQFFEQDEHDIYRWVAGTGVRALLVFEFMFRVSPDYKSWIHGGMMFWFPTTQGDEQAERELQLFAEAFKRGGVVPCERNQAAFSSDRAEKASRVGSGTKGS